ncbi:hypothetical protein EUTSA_v10015610mg [Eutrema salsugineum]|uniref:DUF4408 domain-containing protein n=1 Tax=Eutrema salsugineum TaxID=72664 RepID=V4LM79_EUTSA|nr:uncharacterized protein LOC18018016 [Eutrema salsugineum]ESQ43527.1 hypothetical protein EUTSA_v10015610mg [Eutrema salsugineum]
MDPLITMQDIQYKNGPRISKKPFVKLLDHLFLSLIVVTFCVIVVFSPYWLEVSYSFFLFTIPRVSTYILTSKVSFFLTNVIVITLIGVSRFYSSRSSPPAGELQKEYITRSHSCDSWSYGTVKLAIGDQRSSKENIDQPRLEEGKRKKLSPLQIDSLNQRADNLIARVNRRRSLEIGLLHRP